MPPDLNPESWQQLKELFDQALALPEGRRIEFAATACTGNADLHRRLVSMLKAHATPDGPLDRSVPARLSELFSSIPLVGETRPFQAGEPGQVVLNRYRLTEPIASGGSSEVWLAEDLTLHSRIVVAKILAFDVTPDTLWLKMFAAEVEALSRIDHPAVNRPLDAGHTPGGRPILILEHVRGTTLREVLTQGPISPTRALRIAISIAEGISAAHIKGILHLDLKPENILLRNPGQPDEHPVVLDFGIAQIHRTSFPATESPPVGSPNYMAPEQFEGIASIATDQYALACVLFESLTGRLPASSAFSAVPFGLRNTLRKALSPVPAQRFGSVEEFAHSLERVQRLRRRRIPLLAAVCIAGLVVALAGHYLYSTIRQRRAEREVANTLAGFRMATNAIQNAGYAGSTDPQQSVYLLLQLRRFADIAQPNADSLHTIVAALAEAGMILGHPGRRHAGQTEQALQLLREAVRYADRRSLLAPSHFSAHSAAETRYALSSILIEMDRFQEARAVIVEALRILPVAAHTPSLLQPVQAGLIGNLSRIAFGTRDFPTCLVLRNQYVLMRAAIAGILPDPSNTHALSGAYQARGYLLREMGRHAEAVSDYTRSDEILRGLLTADPDNTQFHWQLARNALEIGRTYSSAGRHRLALPFLESAVGSLRKFIDLNQSDQHTRRELALALAWLAHARASAGASRSNWQPLFDEAIALSQAMAAADPSSAKAQSEWRHVRELAAAAGQIGSSPARPAPWR